MFFYPLEDIFPWLSEKEDGERATGIGCLPSAPGLGWTRSRGVCPDACPGIQPTTFKWQHSAPPAEPPGPGPPSRFCASVKTQKLTERSKECQNSRDSLWEKENIKRARHFTTQRSYDDVYVFSANLFFNNITYMITLNLNKCMLNLAFEYYPFYFKFSFWP